MATPLADAAVDHTSKLVGEALYIIQRDVVKLTLLALGAAGVRVVRRNLLPLLRLSPPGLVASGAVLVALVAAWALGPAHAAAQASDGDRGGAAAAAPPARQPLGAIALLAAALVIDRLDLLVKLRDVLLSQAHTLAATALPALRRLLGLAAEAPPPRRISAPHWLRLAGACGTVGGCAAVVRAAAARRRAAALLLLEQQRRGSGPLAALRRLLARLPAAAGR